MPREPQCAGVEAWRRRTVTAIAENYRGRRGCSLREAQASRRTARQLPSRPADNGSGPPSAADPSAIARGFRLSTELVAGVLVGRGIGWLLDRWLGISPGG